MNCFGSYCGGSLLNLAAVIVAADNLVACCDYFVAAPRLICVGDCGGRQVDFCGGDCGGERFVCVLRLLRRHLNECAAAIAAAYEWMSNWLHAAAIAAAPCRIFGGDCGDGRVELCGGDCGGERFECVLWLF